MSLSGLLRRCRGRHADALIRAEADRVAQDAALAVANVDARQPRGRAIGQLIGALLTTIGSPEVSTAAEEKLKQIEALQDQAR